MADDMKFRFELIENGKRASLQALRGSEKLAQAAYNADEISAMISTLIRVRAAMADPVAEELTDHSGIDFVENPNCRILVDPENAERVIVFRHPGLGWTGYQLTEGMAEYLVKALTRQIAYDS